MDIVYNVKQHGIVVRGLSARIRLQLIHCVSKKEPFNV